MASNINSSDIDANYPVAGQDNDSQGFRDNFNTIKNSLATAKTEITALQDDTAKTNSSNDFNGNTIREANMQANTEVTYATGNLTSSTNIDFNNGHYQIVTVTGSLTLTLTNWAASGKLCKLRVEIKGNSTEDAATVTFSAGSNVLKLDQGFLLSDSTVQGQMTNPFIVDPGKDYIIDFWTHNGGLTVYAQYVGSFA